MTHISLCAKLTCWCLLPAHCHAVKGGGLWSTALRKDGKAGRKNWPQTWFNYWHWKIESDFHFFVIIVESRDYMDPKPDTFFPWENGLRLLNSSICVNHITIWSCKRLWSIFFCIAENWKWSKLKAVQSWLISHMETILGIISCSVYTHCSFHILIDIWLWLGLKRTLSFLTRKSQWIQIIEPEPTVFTQILPSKKFKD